MLKKINFFTFIVIILIGLIVCSGASAQEKKVYNWNFHTDYDKSFNLASHLQHWADTVWEETDHQLKIDIYYNGTLGYSSGDMLSSLKNGLLDAAEIGICTAVVEANKPYWKFNDFFPLYDNWDQLCYVDKAAFPMFRQDILDFGGVVPLGFYSASPSNDVEGIWTNKKIEKWEDFKGMKIRVYYPAARKYIFEPLGINALFIPGSECYQALKNNLIDGVQQCVTSGYISNYYEIAKYFYAYIPLQSSWWGMACSQASFDALPEDIQEGLIRASKMHEEFITNKVWPNPEKYSPGIAGDLTTMSALELFKETDNVLVKVPLVKEKMEEQAIIGLQKWIADEGGPQAQMLYDILLEAKELYPDFDAPGYESLEILNIVE